MQRETWKLATYNNAKFWELVVDLLERWQESLLKTGILGGYGLKNLAVNVENCALILEIGQRCE